MNKTICNATVLFQNCIKMTRLLSNQEQGAGLRLTSQTTVLTGRCSQDFQGHPDCAFYMCSPFPLHIHLHDSPGLFRPL